jgi:L-alanine-DL-glutamate epimerase-like enolase superfamily enzyme
MDPKGFIIKDIERILLNVPFHERCAQTMEIRGAGWSVIGLTKVTTQAGVVGVGETIQGYTWGPDSGQKSQALIGRNLFDYLWDDSLGAGLQMALFDAAGKLLEVPCHKLFGTQFRTACPVSWWAQDMAAEAWAAEARTAVEHGFTTMKVKARPWFDIDAQLAAVSAAVPEYFKLDTDFNTMLLGVDAAAPLINRLEDRYPLLAIVESPIPQGDVAGNRLLRQKIRSAISMHIGQPPVMTAISEGVCDGFVLGGGVSQVLRNGTLAGQAKMPFWLQMVGTGFTTMFSVHLGAVLEQARWPAIPCINIYSHTLLKEFKVEGGHIEVPQGPGLGIEPDWDAIESFRVADDFRKQDPKQIHTIHWPDGRQVHYPDGSYREGFTAGKMTGFLPGIRLERRLDDGSEEFGREYNALFPGA